MIAATKPMPVTVIRKETSTLMAGSTNTKKEMSSPNWGSTCPKEDRLRNCRSVCHSVARRVPLVKPKKSATPQNARRRMGSRASWYPRRAAEASPLDEEVR